LNTERRSLMKLCSETDRQTGGDRWRLMEKGKVQGKDEEGVRDGGEGRDIRERSDDNRHIGRGCPRGLSAKWLSSTL
jgi:hypothetical protein